jgi:uncharacterized protein
MATALVADAAHLRSLVHRHRHAIAEIAARHGAHQVRLVGSVARGDHQATSDIDLLVTLEPRRSLLDLAALHDELVALLGVEVSILTSGSRIGRDPRFSPTPPPCEPTPRQRLDDILEAAATSPTRSPRSPLSCRGDRSAGCAT